MLVEKVSRIMVHEKKIRLPAYMYIYKIFYYWSFLALDDASLFTEMSL